MLEKKPIQVSRYKIDMPKYSAITVMEEYISAHTDEFLDGEEIILKYKDIDDEWVSSNAIVNIRENSAITLDVEIIEKDTVKIIEKDGYEAPEDTDSLWLSDFDTTESGETSDLKSEVRALKLQLAAMQEMLRKHDYALSNTLAGGDIIVNSEKYDEENSDETEEPEDSTYEPSYDTGDTELHSWDIYLGNTSFTELIEEEYEFYQLVKYYMKLRVFNESGKEIENSGYTTTFKCVSTVATVSDNVLYASNSGTCSLTVTLNQGNEIVGYKTYNISFLYNAKPDYETYGEPNVHHLLIKTAETYGILSSNTDYLCVNEFCWCKGNNSLYLKAKASNGVIGLFKINGEGSEDPTGSTSAITYTVDDEGFIVISDDNNGYAYVDSEGYINILSGNVDTEGYIVLNDTAPNN